MKRKSSTFFSPMKTHEEKTFTVRKIIDIFGATIVRNTLLRAEAEKQIPLSQRIKTGATDKRFWKLSDLPEIGERYGFLKALERPIAISLFTTKGGVLKTTLALNIARMAALHNIKTCVVGLDLQGDISRGLGLTPDLEESETLEVAIDAISSVNGLYDVHQRTIGLDKVLMETDIPSLFFIPETPELVQLEQVISLGNRREYWLKDYVVEPLKKKFDLIIMDCSPNWNRLITNALVASDVLISPLECRINNYRNCTMFRAFISTFQQDLKAHFETIFVPTRLNASKKLSIGIRNWYSTNIPGCTHNAIRETGSGEDAVTLKISLPEHAPTSLFAQEMRELLSELWARIEDAIKRNPTSLDV